MLYEQYYLTIRYSTILNALRAMLLNYPDSTILYALRAIVFIIPLVYNTLRPTVYYCDVTTTTSNSSFTP